MIFWIRKIAAVLGIGAFFMLLFVGLAGADTFGSKALAWAFGRAFAGAALFWVVGIVIADILLKGVITDIEVDQKCLLEGGLVQQAHSIQQRTAPGGPEMPFTEIHLAKRDKSREKS